MNDTDNTAYDYSTLDNPTKQTEPENKSGSLKQYEAVIKVLMPSNSKVTDYKIVVSANSQLDAMAKVLKEWTDRTNPDNFQSIDIKKLAGKFDEKVI